MKRAYFSILIVSALLLRAAIIAEPSDAKQSAPAETEAQNKNTPSTPVPTPHNHFSPNAATDHREAETYNYYGDFNYILPKAAPGSFWASAVRIASALSAVLVAIFTGALVWTSIKQWKAINEQAKIARATLNANRFALGVSRRSAEAAQRAAVAAEESNEVARNAAATELRAYLSVAQILVICPTLDDPSYRPGPGVLGDFVQVIVKNSGRTPAYETRVTANSWVVPARSILPDDFVYPDLSPPGGLNFLTASLTLPSASEHAFNCPSVPSAELLELVRSQERWLYIYGHVDYVDVFHKPHHTPFCWLYVQGPTSTEYGFTTYKDHNDPD